VKQGGESKPTKRNTEFVASEEARSRAARQLLAGLWRSIRRQLPVPDGSGGISLWVCQVSGLAALRLNGPSIESQQPHIEAALQALGPEASPEKISQKFAAANALKASPYYRDMMAAASGENFATFDIAFTEVIPLRTAGAAHWRPALVVASHLPFGAGSRLDGMGATS
jgi:hypothetical protein